MSGARIRLDTHGTFVKNPEYTLFSAKPLPTEEYLAETFEVPFDASRVNFGDTATTLIPPKGDVIRRVNVRAVLPPLYNPLGPGYVYPSYSDQVNGSVYVQTNTLAIQPGDFVGYFNTQFLNQWATNFVGYSNISVAYNSTLSKFVFTSPTYANIFFQNENSASFWGFDIRSPDFFTPSGYFAYNFTNGTLTAPLTLTQAGWIRGFTPPPPTGFSYKESVACRLIKNASLTIGGQTIDRLTSERLIIEDDIGVPYENQGGLTILQGKNDTSTITAEREYYTRLTFNTDTISMNALKNQDVRVNIEFEKFENLPSNLITTNSLTDGGSYTNINLIPLLYGSQPLYPSSAPRVLHNIAYKNYIIYVIKGLGGTDYWFYDTTKPINSLSSYTKWTDTYAFYASNNNLRNPYIIGNDMYYSDGSHTIFKVNVNAMLAGTATVTPGVTFFNNKYTPSYVGANPQITSDARYLYIIDTFGMYSIGSNSMVLTDIYGSTSTSLTANLAITANIVTVTTSAMIPSDNTAFINFLTNYSPAPVSPATTKTVSIKSQTVITSNLVVTANVSYTNGSTPVLQNFKYAFVYPDKIWIRYDTTKPINDWNSYSYVSWAGTTTPKPFFDFIGGWEGAFGAMYPSTDGRYIYGSDITFYPVSISYVSKVDTQSFLTESSYTFFNVGTLSPQPVITSTPGLPFPSDGRYIYFQSLSPSKIFTLYRYDSTKSVTDQSAWTYTTFSDTRFYNYSGNGYPLTPVTFDGKHIYYVGPSAYGPSATQEPTLGYSIVTYFSILRYDTTTSSVKDWIVFNGTSNTVATSSGTTTISMTPYAKQNGRFGSNVYAQYLGMNVGSRYIYIYEKWGGDFATWSDFIQFDPLTMSGLNLPTSVIVKYEKYVKPPPTNQISLYGQTDVNEFTFVQGRTVDSFNLEFVNPVREMWVVVQDPGVVSRLILRLNNEIIIDDDQVTARYIRTFETHTTMPTSSNVNVYSFSLNPEKLHPSGTLNMSRIAYPVLDVTLASAAPTNLYLRVYTKSFNVLGYQGGIGGLLFNSGL